MRPGATSQGGPAPGPPIGDAVLSAMGMVTPVGADLDQSLTSVRAGLRRVVEQPELYTCLPEDARFDPPTPLLASAVYHLDAAPRRGGRVAEWLGLLAGHAFADLARRARLGPPELSRLGLFLALPARDGLGPAQRDELVYHFHNHAERDLLPSVHLAFGGHATGLALLEAAAAALREGRLGRAAVGAADSWLFRAWLERLDLDWRLLSDRNGDGFQPGEAAAFVLLESRAEAVRRGLRPLARLLGHTAARLAVAPGGQAHGAELAAVVGPLVGADEAPLLVCDLNGESARTSTWAFAVARLGGRLGKGYALEHPASALGDVGAASSLVDVAVAAAGLHGRHAERTGAVVWAAGEDGERRAVRLERC